MNIPKLPITPPSVEYCRPGKQTEISRKLTELWQLCTLKNDYTEYLEEKAKYDTNSKTS